MKDNPSSSICALHRISRGRRPPRLIVALLFVALLAGVVRSADALSETLQQGLLAEEAHHDLDAAIASYRSVIAQYDDQRRLVATALFRLGESYRKQGKTTEAVAQYQRLIAEFNDQSELARLSRQHLENLAPGSGVASASLPPARQRQKDLLAEELALIEQQMAEVRNRISVGRASSGDLIPLQRDALSIQRQMAALDASPPADLLSLSSSTAPGDSPVGLDGVSEEETREIERLKAMIRHSPDLINATGGAEPPLRTAAGRGQLAVAQLLIDNGADLDVQTGDGRTPLHSAVASGHKAMTELLIAAGARIDTKDRQSRTPLHLAAGRGFREIAKVLLASGANVNVLTHEGTPLHAATMQGHVHVIDLLLDSGADLEARTSDSFAPLAGHTPLLQALSVNFEPAVLERLLSRGANVNATNAAGDAVLHVAVEKSIPARDLRAILERKPDLEARSSQHQTPLLIACDHRNHSAARVLLEAGADPNGRMPAQVLKGSTPLHWAAAQWDRVLVQMLIEHGADPNATDDDGNTPLLAAIVDRGSDGSLVGDPILVDLLLDAGADPNVADKNGTSLLQHSVRVGVFEMVARLLAKGVNPNSTDSSGATPLHAAAFKPVVFAELLLDHGAEVDHPDQLGHTPLHVAARVGNKDVVQLLLARGASVSARNKRGMTPLNLVEDVHAPYATEPGRGLVEAFDRQGRQIRAIAALPPPGIDDILIEHGAESARGSTGEEGATFRRPSALPTRVIPPRNVRSAADPTPPVDPE